jgi:hypothetical protein
MALRIVWRNPLPSIRTNERGRIMSNEFRATSPVTASDPMTEMDLAVLLVDHGLGVDSTTLALTSPWLWPLVLPPLQSHTSGSY